MPKGVYDRASSKWTPPARKKYPPELVDRVRELYESGLTMAETAAAAGTTVKVLQRLMPRHGIARRRAVPRNQSGEKNAMWKGNDAGYQALHLRVANARGKPSACEWCGAEGAGHHFEWANLTGDYTDIDEAMQLPWRCVDLEAGRLTIEAETTKDKEGRTVTLVSETSQALRGIMPAAIEPGEEVFAAWPYDRTQAPWRALNNRLKAVIVAAGLASSKADVGRRHLWHKLRRTFATAIYRESRDIELVRDMLGHSDQKTTWLYIDKSQIDRKTQADLLPTPNRGPRLFRTG